MQSDSEKSALLGAADPNPKVVDQSKGARPKIRNPKEAKRRRFVMKQAKTIAKPQPLESVSETEEGTTLLPKGSELNEPTDTKSTKRSEFFGVRSYVHTFYEAMAMDNPHTYEEGGNSFDSVGPIRKRRKIIICYRILLTFGWLVMAMGFISIMVGYFAPRKKEVVDIQEDIEVINRENQAFNRDLDICKMVGIALFCAGGILMIVVLYALIALRQHQIEEMYSEDIPLAEPAAEDEAGPASPIDVKVPATEELTAIQPKRVDPEEVVMTNAGLCKVP